MRISELADETGVSIATLKFYLREGVLQPGRALGATRADYDASHVARVRLVRALVEVGRLSIERVGEVVAALDNPPASRHELLGAGHHALRGAAAVVPGEEDLAQVAELGVADCADSPASTQLAVALAAARAGGWPVADEVLASWYAAQLTVADTDVAPELGELPAADALRHVVVGNVLTDPVVIALRRVAQETVSGQRFGGAADRSTARGGPQVSL